MTHRLIHAGLIALGAAVIPAQAFAANFGFVRWPDYLDAYIFLLMIPVAIGFIWLKMTLPKGMSLLQVPKEQRTKSMTFVGYLTMAALISLMALIFIGMGLQRFAEL
ncbi:MAG: hypothetical protein PHX82_16065 [Paracoccaceae bacterium]|nr:hypothetical protein [Paracoccaceae bacterium]